MDYVQTIKNAMEDGESLAAVLEGVGQVVNEYIVPSNAKEDKKILNRILLLLQEAQSIAAKGGL